MLKMCIKEERIKINEVSIEHKKLVKENQYKSKERRL